MVKIIIYSGLSIPFDEARCILDSNEQREVIYRKPIQRGDLKKDLKYNPDVIGIIDGVFHQNSAVGHREILEAINQGVEVYGASSMGALRACELDSLGMKGIGYCYQQYATGEVESDDDVAVMLNGDTLQALSVPLINMKYIFENATRLDVLTDTQKDELLKIAKSIYYPQRNYSTVLNKSSLTDSEKDILIDFINQSIDIKKEDAKKLLKHIDNHY